MPPELARLPAQARLVLCRTELLRHIAFRKTISVPPSRKGAPTSLVTSRH
jgi:hypothetical protein